MTGTTPDQQPPDEPSGAAAGDLATNGAADLDPIDAEAAMPADDHVDQLDLGDVDQVGADQEAEHTTQPDADTEPDDQPEPQLGEADDAAQPVAEAEPDAGDAPVVAEAAAADDDVAGTAAAEFAEVEPDTSAAPVVTEAVAADDDVAGAEFAEAEAEAGEHTEAAEPGDDDSAAAQAVLEPAESDAPADGEPAPADAEAAHFVADDEGVGAQVLGAEPSSNGVHPTEAPADAAAVATATDEQPDGTDAEHTAAGVPDLASALEAVLMVVDEPIPSVQLAQVLETPRVQVEETLQRLSAEYTEAGRGFDLRPVAGGWRFYSRPECAPVVERFILDGQQARLTQAALETLAVVAYRQPVSRARVSAIRGVNCDGVVRTLTNRGLIEEAGTEQDSNAVLYRTTMYFLERLGLQNLEELPDIAPYLPAVDELDDAEEVAG